MTKHFMVVDGADKGRAFPLGETGSVVIGSSRKNADISLHDIYVARAHCQVDTDGGRVVVSPLEPGNATLVNGQAIAKAQPIQVGDVVRVGNTFLALHDGDPPKQTEAEPEEKKPAVVAEPGAAVSRMSVDRMGELSGKAVGNYELGPLLGTGRHGAVFQAKDRKTGQAVALKVFLPDFPANDQELQRFVQAIRPVLAMRHRHLVNLAGAGKSGPYCWLAREYVDGKPGTAFLEKGPKRPSWKRAYRFAVHLARALQYAHGQKRVHRGVTPADLLYREADKVVKLANVGVAPALAGSALGKAVQESKRATWLAYLAPEQANDQNYVDALCDIYSLGAVLYALLTCRPPVLGREAAEVLRRICLATPPKIRDQNPEVPAGLEAIVFQMMAKRQEDRYQSADEVLAELEEFGEEQGVVLEEKAG